jgi:hypothetical protein
MDMTGPEAEQRTGRPVDQLKTASSVCPQTPNHIREPQAITDGLAARRPPHPGTGINFQSPQPFSLYCLLTGEGVDAVTAGSVVHVGPARLGT